ncbi:YtpR family tRNA-binding protein [Saliterribacillus persicus]|uniref:tRNA-binding protein n=1 Tax=Saliterribacillus persicus TaxID=930114 RepID=A0A368X4D7_9BACI|nr:DUF4479 family protein [Saliterribacillus persicus]RCW62665.1 tRNA-binding protein [Saliterribacillus persicus]
MHVFYNQKGIGDVLLIPIKIIDRDEVKFQAHQDVVKIMDKGTNEVVGYNIFNASHYFKDLETGKNELTENFLTRIEEVFSENELNESLDVDLRPKFVVGFVESIDAHENADKLRVCQVDVGDETLQIVCGAPNVDVGQKVVVARVGAIMPSGMEIKPTQLRGVDSNGMICSQKELGIPNAPKEKGIYVLDENKKAGETFLF